MNSPPTLSAFCDAGSHPFSCCRRTSVTGEDPSGKGVVNDYSHVEEKKLEDIDWAHLCVRASSTSALHFLGFSANIDTSLYNPSRAYRLLLHNIQNRDEYNYKQRKTTSGTICYDIYVFRKGMKKQCPLSFINL